MFGCLQVKRACANFLIGQGTELLITGEQDWELFRGINHGIHRLILLSDGQCVREDNGQVVLFKYQSAESMLQEGAGDRG